MYMQTIISLALAGSVLATPTKVERDLPTVTNALAGINSAATNLDGLVKSFSGAGDVAGLTSAGAALLSAINDANTKIAASSELSLTDAIGLQGASGGLTTGAQTLVDDIIAKKSAFDAVCASGAVLEQLQKQKDASATLAKTIVSKLPSALQSLGESQSGGVVDAVNKGISAYQGASSANCQSAGSGSGSSSGSAPSSAVVVPPVSSAAAPAASSAAPAPAASSAAAPPSGYSGASASAPAPSGTPKASATPSRPATTPSASVVPFTGGAASQTVGMGFVAVAAVFAIAL